MYVYMCVCISIYLYIYIYIYYYYHYCDYDTYIYIYIYIYTCIHCELPRFIHPIVITIDYEAGTTKQSRLHLTCTLYTHITK